MFWHYSREGRAGISAWWHFGRESRRVLSVEFYWWSHRCHASISVDDEGWNWAFAFPPLALYVGFDGFPSWTPQRKCIATWDHDREFWVTDQRECRIAVHDWALWIVPWGRSMEWRTKDPWWVRGITIRPAKVLGKWIGEKTIIEHVPVDIPMPEGVYRGVARVEQWTRGRRFWFKRRTREVWLEIPNGIPHAGKGENSYDCGDDGLFGIGGSSIDNAIGNAVSSVLRDRRRYGHASEEAVQKALSH